MATDITSPRLQQLADNLTTAAIETFWAEIATIGTPLIEPIDDRKDRYLVTFLWRETEAEPLRNITMLEWFSGEDMTLQSQQLRKLPDSDVWYRTLTMSAGITATYRMMPNDTLIHLRDDPDSEGRFKRSRIDPLNPRRTVDTTSDSADENTSVFSLPGAPAYPTIAATDSAPAAAFTEHTLHSEILGQDRLFWTHAPVDMPVDAWVMIQVDAQMVREPMHFPQLVSVIDASDDLPPMLTVFVDTSDRGGDLPCNPLFADFMADELLPFIRAQHGVLAAKERVIIAGQSYGGLAAGWIGLYRHDTVGNVLAQSGSFWWWPDYGNGDRTDLIGQPIHHCWLPTWASSQPLSPTRFWLEAGVLEDHPEGRAPSLLTAHRTMRDVLIARGYNVRYREYPGGHDFWMWRALYLDGLRHLTSPETA